MLRGWALREHLSLPLRPCWCSAAAGPPRAGVSDGERFARRFARTTAVAWPSYSSEQPSPSLLLPQGLLDQGCAVGVGAWPFYTSWPRWVLGLSGECTRIYCFNLSPSWLYYPCSEPNFPFKRSFLSKRRLRPSCQLLLRVELNASSPVAATERCVSWDLREVSEPECGGDR